MFLTTRCRASSLTPPPASVAILCFSTIFHGRRTSRRFFHPRHPRAYPVVPHLALRPLMRSPPYIFQQARPARFSQLLNASVPTRSKLRHGLHTHSQATKLHTLTARTRAHTTLPFSLPPSYAFPAVLADAHGKRPGPTLRPPGSEKTPVLWRAGGLFPLADEARVRIIASLSAKKTRNIFASSGRCRYRCSAGPSYAGHEFSTRRAAASGNPCSSESLSRKDT